MEKNIKGWFHEGRGSVSDKLAKSGDEVLSQENEAAVPEAGSTDSPAGRKPVYATGPSPFHSGRGAGRGNS